MYAIGENSDERELVGVYKGNTNGKYPRGLITPAVGLRKLVWNQVDMEENGAQISLSYKNGPFAKMSYAANKNGTCILNVGLKQIKGTIIKVPETMKSKFSTRDHSYDSEEDIASFDDDS